MDDAWIKEQAVTLYHTIRGRLIYPSNAEDERAAAVEQIMDTLRATYADGQRDGIEQAAGIANEERVDYDTTRDESDRAYNLACADIEAAIRQHAKEMGHE